MRLPRLRMYEETLRVLPLSATTLPETSSGMANSANSVCKLSREWTWRQPILLALYTADLCIMDSAGRFIYVDVRSKPVEGDMQSHLLMHERNKRTEHGASRHFFSSAVFDGIRPCVIDSWDRLGPAAISLLDHLYCLAMDDRRKLFFVHAVPHVIVLLFHSHSACLVLLFACITKWQCRALGLELIMILSRSS